MANGEPLMPDADIPATINRVRKSFEAGRSKPPGWRRGQLQQLRQMLVKREDDFLEALAADLGKCRTEGWVSEVGFLTAEIRHTLKHLRRWLKAERVRTPLSSQPGRSRIVREPLGVVLIMGAWNYPR